MHPWKSTARCIGIAVLAFGVGLLLSMFLPKGFLALVEAIVIIGIGVLYFSAK